MAQTMWDFFVSGFQNPSAWGIGLAFAFGAVWLAAYSPWALRRLGLRTPILVLALLAVFVSSAILAWAAIGFIQIPLQYGSNWVIARLFGEEALIGVSMLAALIPYILLSGLVQEAAKLLPPFVFMKWKRPQGARLALIIGAISGAGFGIFEAQWALNMTFASGWSWGTVELQGFQALFGFWERFFAVGLHIGLTAIAVYGLFKGKWWQFYLLAAFLHAFLNYSVVLLAGGYITILQLEIYAAVVTLATVGLALWLRWRREKGLPVASETEGEEATDTYPRS